MGRHTPFSLDAVELFDACISLGISIVAACHDHIQRGAANAQKHRPEIPVGYCLCGCGPTARVESFDLNGALKALEEDAQVYRLYPGVISECFAPYSDAPKIIWFAPEYRRGSSAHHAALLSILDFLILVDPGGARRHFSGLSEKPSESRNDPTFFPDAPLPPRQLKAAIAKLRAAPSFGDYAEQICPWLTLELANARSSLPQVRLDRPAPRVHVDDVDSFRKVRRVKNADIATYLANGFLRQNEDTVQRALEDILGVPTHRKDWGGEGNDLYTANVVINRVRLATAFLLKGPGIGKRVMTIRDCGKNGDQLVRRFGAPADLFVVQYVGPIADALIADVEGKVAEKRAQGKSAQFMIIDGQDTARLLYAYGKLRKDEP